MTSIKGSCLCGAITYASESTSMSTAICHCRDCQRQSGGAFSVNVLVPSEGFAVAGKGLSHYSKTGSSGLPAKRHFCSNCGSALYSEIAFMPGVVLLKAGSLMDTCSVQPSMHLWCGSAMTWVEIDRSLPCFEFEACD